MKTNDRPKILPEGCLQGIMEIPERDNRVSIANLCKIFNTTSVSIRNNLNRLEKVRLLKRTDGGAFHYKPPFLGLALSEKEKLQADEKKRFAKETVRLIFEGSTLQRTLPY